MGQTQTALLLCGWSTYTKAHPAEYWCQFTHIHLQSAQGAHAPPGPRIPFPIPALSTQTHLNRRMWIHWLYTRIIMYAAACTCKNSRQKGHTDAHVLTWRQKKHHMFTHTHALKQSHVSQSHIPRRAAFTAEKTDWACLFVGSPLHVCLLCFSQWKTSILRIIKWLKS